MSEISNHDDIIDSRDIIERIEELRSLIENEGCDDTCQEYKDELEVLESIAEEAAGYSPDWEHGETLIRETYWVDYVKELLEDCGELPRNLPSYVVIDWDATADNIQADYTEIDFDGVTYFMRSC